MLDTHDKKQHCFYVPNALVYRVTIALVYRMNVCVYEVIALTTFGTNQNCLRLRSLSRETGSARPSRKSPRSFSKPKPNVVLTYGLESPLLSLPIALHQRMSAGTTPLVLKADRLTSAACLEKRRGLLDVRPSCNTPTNGGRVSICIKEGYTKAYARVATEEVRGCIGGERKKGIFFSLSLLP